MKYKNKMGLLERLLGWYLRDVSSLLSFFHKFPLTLDKSWREASAPSEILYPEAVPGWAHIFGDI